MYTVKLEKFEGPLELLLELIEKAKLDISEISLAAIADQFLSHLGEIQEKEPAYLADFLVVAAKLILIKSKAMLPFFSITQEEEEEIKELKDKLATYQKIRERAKLISELDKKQMIAYHRTSNLKNFRIFIMPEGLTAEILFEHFKNVLAFAHKPEISMEERKIEIIISFEEKIKEIRERLRAQLQISFKQITSRPSTPHMIISFLAILELARQKFLTAEQEEIFGEIELTHIGLMRLSRKPVNLKT